MLAWAVMGLDLPEHTVSISPFRWLEEERALWVLIPKAILTLHQLKAGPLKKRPLGPLILQPSTSD